LLDQLKAPAYEIVRGEENTTLLRRSAIIACQNMTNHDQGSIVLIDEADNLLNTQSSWFMRGETQDKGWLNHFLDEPGTRMIWISNRIDSIEGSVLRRFAFSLHFKSFNRRQRVLLWDNILRKNKCKKYCAQIDVENFAKNYDVSAGVIDLATRKAKENTPSSKVQFSHSVEMALESYEILANNGEKPTNKDEIEKNYSLDGLNIDGDLDAMLTQLEAFDVYLRNDDHMSVLNMNLLFYGTPGAGKSELARYIANRLDRKAICKRISDLQSMYVGEGEKNIKRAFLEAENEEAILIIDEADSLLFSRDRARHSWEISFTNEFLTQMERYRGILICTTNRFKGLDNASIRRFNHKIGFDYLTAEGNLLFYNLFFKPLSLEKLDHTSRTELQQIKNLAPGDYKVVRDRYLFHPKSDISHILLIDALKNEAKLKTNHGQVKQIGFN
jgi:SpoVK/Ycf46/Vps4 family AAA+-type ATPase